ncbi:MAG: bifunctional hydroxymethylpyrimidine kinase/phosphomethylpyrimidine kinase [Thermoprotei archaeon]|nr:MAG: bifunctional hydroxymethylpyrimidine kinase/phosphomethylpyrimidine kinase [Thermoprotei archaeon]
MVWIDIYGKVPVAMTIAGSDSGGGAGIEADLKTFAALGVHGTVVLTAITAQNTTAVTGVQDVELDIIEKQIDAVVSDIGVDAAKTGMLHTSEIIRVVAKKVREYKFPLVVDPVMIAKSGAPLLKQEAVKTLIEELLPLATVLTPNAREAEVLCGFKVSSLEDQKRAAKKIAELGPKAVVVKGGHLYTEKSVDVLYYDGEYYFYEAERIESKNTHGTGCSFSAAIAAELAKGKTVVEAVSAAKELITAAIRYGIPVGRGHGPVNPLALLYKESERHRVLRSVVEAFLLLMNYPRAAELVPEVGTNIAMALPYADNLNDVAAIPGRIRKAGNKVTATLAPEFGASSHLARYILTIVKHDPRKRAAVNIRFNKKFIEAARELGLTVSFYDRRKEPPEVKAVEGATIPWGVSEAIKNAGGRVPDVIYHEGDWGKEPMIVVLGETAVDCIKLALKIAEKALGEKHG